MSYQKCPICDGAGLIPTPLMTTYFEQCPVCKGERIIDEVTGAPPGWSPPFVINFEEEIQPPKINNELH